MKYTRIVMTCGISVFAINNCFRKWIDATGLLRFDSPSAFPTPSPPANMTVQQAIDGIERAVGTPQALQSLIRDDKRVSAEYSALAALEGENRLAEQPTIVLIHTNTFGGTTAAILLASVMARRFDARVETAECSIEVDDREQLQFGLGDFMHKVASALRDYDKYTACFVPLGGYKIMTSLGSMAGAYFGYPTLYLHEDKQIFHEVPGIPWKMEQAAIAEMAPLLKKIGKGYDFNDLTKNEQRLVEDRSWLFERAEDIVCVNAFGLFLMHENPKLFQTRLLVDESVDREYENDSRRDFVVQQLGVLATKLMTGSKESDLRHERDWDVQPNDDWHLYKGASNGQHCMRAIYRYDTDGDVLTVRKVWTSHDYTERFASEWTKNPTRLVEWSFDR